MSHDSLCLLFPLIDPLGPSDSLLDGDPLCRYRRLLDPSKTPTIVSTNNSDTTLKKKFSHFPLNLNRGLC